MTENEPSCQKLGLKLQQLMNMFFTRYGMYFLMPSYLTRVSAFSSLSPTEAFLPSQCSYSSRASRCWCTLEHNEEELRTIHMVYLCVTSIVGNVTSKLLDFTPLGIRKWVCPHVWFGGQRLGAEIGYWEYSWLLLRVHCCLCLKRDFCYYQTQQEKVRLERCSVTGCHKFTPHDLTPNFSSCSLSEARPPIKRVGATGGGTWDKDERHLESPSLLEVSWQLLWTDLWDQIQTSHVLI